MLSKQIVLMPTIRIRDDKHEAYCGNDCQFMTGARMCSLFNIQLFTAPAHTDTLPLYERCCDCTDCAELANARIRLEDTDTGEGTHCVTPEAIETEDDNSVTIVVKAWR